MLGRFGVDTKRRHKEITMAYAGAPLGDDEGKKGPSREEIETLCILHAVGQRGCRNDDLAPRLGLSSSLARAIVAGVEPLVIQGWLFREETRLVLTDAGRERLKGSLAEWLD
jgi:hypothetical protein